MTPLTSPSDPMLRRRTMRCIAWACTVLVCLIVGLSAFLRLAKAGLGCEPWPQCYGQALRGQQQGITPDDAAVQGVAMARLAHRVVASVALVLVIMLVMGTLSARPRQRSDAAHALGLLALALFLAGLGLRTGASRLPAVALGNLLGGFAMLALSWRLAASDAPRALPHGPPARWAGATFALLAMQVALGGLLSTTYADLSCGGIADCARRAAQQGWPWATLDPWREPVFAASSALPVNPVGALVQLVHRVGALVVGLMVLGTAWLAWRHGRGRAAVTLGVLLLLQLTAGWWLLTPALPLAAALAHNLIAAAMAALLARLV